MMIDAIDDANINDAGTQTLCTHLFCFKFQTWRQKMSEKKQERKRKNSKKMRINSFLFYFICVCNDSVEYGSDDANSSPVLRPPAHFLNIWLEMDHFRCLQTRFSREYEYVF